MSRLRHTRARYGVAPCARIPHETLSSFVSPLPVLPDPENTDTGSVTFQNVDNVVIFNFMFKSTDLHPTSDKRLTRSVHLQVSLRECNNPVVCVISVDVFLEL